MNTARAIPALILACASALMMISAARAQTFEHPQQPQTQPQPHAQGQAQPRAQGQPHGQTPVPHYTQPTVHTNPSHYYPPHGTAVSAPPPSPVIINRPNGRYYYSGGVWYAPRGSTYVVVAAPVGVFVPVLPVYYSTVWVSGAPYYYANDTYYSWSPQQNSYEVVAPPTADGIPPPDDSDSAAAPPAQSDGLYVYPQNGQSDQQQASDRYECHKWATAQTGFDPTQAGGAASADQPGGDPEGYQRAMKACLEGRGYSVR